MKPASVCIATPAYEGSCRMGYVESLMHLVLALREHQIELYFTTTQKSAVIATARNLCVDYFLRSTRATHLLFIDSDMRFQAEDILRMLEHSQHDIVAALCPAKDYDWDKIAELARRHPTLPADRLPLLGTRLVRAAGSDGKAADLHNVNQDGLIEVNAIGTGLMLIRRDVFERLSVAHPDWLQTSGLLAGGHAYFEGGRTAGGFISEDLAFCNAARALGARVFACDWLRIGHIGNHEFVRDPSQLIE